MARVLAAVKPPNVTEFLDHHLPICAPCSTVTIRETGQVGLPAVTPTDDELAALIAIGGEGTRYGMAPKELQLIYNKPAVFYYLSQALQAGAKRMLIATSRESRPLIEKYVGDGSSFGASIEYYVVENPRGGCPGSC